MEFDGVVRKERNSKYWVIYVPAFDLATQGTSKEDAFDMLGDAIKELVHSYFGKSHKNRLRIFFDKDEGSGFGVSASDNKVLLSLALRRQREMSGSSVRDVSSRLKSRSPNAYAQYERGKLNISLDKYEKLLQAANPETTCAIRIG